MTAWAAGTAVGISSRIYSQPPSPTYTWRIMKDALKQHEGTVTTGGRTITSPHFYIHVFEGKERKLSSLWKLLVKKPQLWYGYQKKERPSSYLTMPKTSTLKSKSAVWKQYVGFIISNEGSNPGILERIVHSRNSKT